jgi:glycosyltransferase involved in cell wall biosynthesis
MNIVSLLTITRQPCAVEQFARRLAQELAAARPRRRLCCLPLTGKARELAALWGQLPEAGVVMINLPLVGWKRRFAAPVLAALLTRLRRRDVVVILHEWGDLDFRRRLVLAPVLLLATRLLLSAPRVERQLRTSRLSRLLTRRRQLIPIPPNLCRPRGVHENDISRRLREVRAAGRTIIGQFGSLYPTKHNMALLDVAADLGRRGHDVFTVFIGDFIRGRDTLEEQFRRRVAALDLDEAVWVTGFIGETEDLFAVLDEVDVFVYRFSDGLTSNRSSVLTCLQTSRPIVVNAPRSEHEFDHHVAFRAQIQSGRLRLVPTYADAAEVGDAVEAVLAQPAPRPLLDPASMWDDVVRALEGHGPAAVSAGRSA